MSYQVVVQPSGHQFVVEPGETILDAALRQGFAFPYGCRNGGCGACRGKMLSGTVEYDDGLPAALSAEQLRAGMALFCRALPTSDLVLEMREIGAAKDIVVKTLPCRVAKLELLSHDVMRLMLKLPVTERLQFLAGQYIDILLKDGRRRTFSLANAPHDDNLLELHIRNVPGGDFTHHVFTEMKEKDLLRFEGPFGNFFLREDSDRPMVFMAGGTGFAPIKGILEHAFALGEQRHMHLFWGARSLEDLYWDALPREWAEKYPNFSYTPVLSEPAQADNWTGRTGLVHEAILADYPALSGYDVYAGGAPAMVHAGADAFAQCGLELEHYYSDAFEFNKDAKKSP